MLERTPHGHCPAWSNSLGMATDHKCICNRIERAMIAFADAERERCAKIADACAVRADRVEVINAFGVEAASNAVKLAEGIATAIRNPLYQHEKDGSGGGDG